MCSRKILFRDVFLDEWCEIQGHCQGGELERVKSMRTATDVNKQEFLRDVILSRI